MAAESILFVPSVRETQWITRMLPGISPAELPIAGRRMVDYQLEYAQKFGVLLTEILDWHYSPQLAKEFQNPEEKGFPVFYSQWNGQLPRGLNDLDGLSTPLTHSIADGLIVVWGLCLSEHMRKDVRLEPLSEAECADTPMGVYLRRDGKWMRVKPYGVSIGSVKAWHRTNLAVLHQPGLFTLPCYSAEADVHLGRNVVLEHGSDVKPPVLLSDNTWFARNVILDGDVIVGSGSFVGEGAVLRRTIVGGDTYIGTGLELEDKIVVGNRIIDAETGAWMDMEEPGVARSIGGGFGWLKSLWRFLRGRSYGRLG